MMSCIFFVSLLSSPVAADDGKSVDAVLLIDSSGSMKKTDPANLRKAAARLFLSLLRDNDRVGLVSFSDEGQKLSDLTEVGDKQKRTGLIKSLEKITSDGKYTNIYDGLQKGYELLKPSSNKERLLILMSDGQMDLGDKAREDSLTKEMQAVLLPELKKTGLRIYTIAFTEFSDRALLEDLALKTGGSFKVAQTDKDLHLVFTSMFERIKSPDALPIKDNAFQVDKDIAEFTLLITKKTPKIRIAIKDPAGKEYKAGRKATDMEWFESGAFDMITVKGPAPGAWSIKFSSEQGNKVFIITNLKLLSSFSKTVVEQGKPLKFEAWLTKDNELLKTKEILKRIKISVNIKNPDGKEVAAPLHDDGTNNDATAGDGVYTLLLPIEQPGEYNLTLTAEGETFRREKVFVFNAKTPLAVVVKTIVDEKTEGEKKEKFPFYHAGLISLVLAVAVMLLAVLSVYLYFLARKYKKIVALTEKQKNAPSGILEKNIGEKLKETTIQQPAEAKDGGVPEAQAPEEQLKELDTSVSMLEEENVRLAGNSEKWQEELKKMEGEREHEKGMEESEFNRLAREKEGLEDKLRELKESLDVREKALMSLQQNYEALEQEYMALYKEHQQ